MYTTILVHIDGGGDQDSPLPAAARLANEHGAHLVGSAATGVTWLDHTRLTGSIGAPIPDPQTDFEGLRVVAEGRLDAFRRDAVRLGSASFEAGLVVAGTYGHSRYREWVRGGATRELLERAHVPLLIAH